MYKVNLSYDEIILLDGKCNKEAQKLVDKAKLENSFGLDPICNAILAQSIKSGKLTWTRVTISSCIVCAAKPAGYHTYDRNSRYHSKGSYNYDKPLRYSGIKPNQGSLIVENAPGLCIDCWFDIYLPKLIKHIIDNDLPIEIQKNNIAETKYIRDNIRICKDCGNKIQESKMGKEYSLFRRGDTYPATCPYCFSEANTTTEEFVMIKREDNTNEKI